jgi:hypothetical protein
MGLIMSQNDDFNNLQFYNHLKYDSINLQVIKTIDPTKFIGVIKEGYKNKKLLCRMNGYKLSKDADYNILYATFNSCINEANGKFDAKIHSVDSYGHVLVTLNYYHRNSSVNYKMLLSEGIKIENHIYYGDCDLDIKN